jgi:hypothetical protein
MEGGGLEILKKDAYVVAVVPALVFFGVYAYEVGRFQFLKLPFAFISLPVNRLLVGGILVGLMTALILALTVWTWRSWISLSRMRGIAVGAASALILFSLPLTLWSVNEPSVRPLLVAIAIVGGGAGAFIYQHLMGVFQQESFEWLLRRFPDVPDGSRAVRFANALQRFLHDEIIPGQFLLIPMLFAWSAISFAGLGFAVERHSTDRLCVGDQMVAALSGEHLLLKDVDPHFSVISDETRIAPLGDQDFRPCKFKSVSGGNGLNFDRLNFPAF